MSRDTYADSVKNALIKDGWTITEDPLRLTYGGKEVYIDLGAERTIAAEKDGQEIAVEIKSFFGSSDVKDLRDALGQYVMYRDILTALKSERTLYLAVTEEVYRGVFDTPFARLFMELEKLNLITFDPDREVIKQWIQQQ